MNCKDQNLVCSGRVTYKNDVEKSRDATDSCGRWRGRLRKAEEGGGTTDVDMVEGEDDSSSGSIDKDEQMDDYVG